MKRNKILFALSALLTLGNLAANAQELLVNGDLNSTAQIGPTALYYPEFTDWTIITDPCSYSPCAISPYVPGAFYTQYSGYPSAFADRLNPGSSGNAGLIATSFEGYYPFEIVGPVDIQIQQSVPGTPGLV